MSAVGMACRLRRVYAIVIRQCRWALIACKILVYHLKISILLYFCVTCSVCILHASTDNFGSGGDGGFCFELLLSLDGDGFAFSLAWKAWAVLNSTCFLAFALVGACFLWLETQRLCSSKSAKPAEMELTSVVSHGQESTACSSAIKPIVTHTHPFNGPFPGLPRWAVRLPER